MEFWKRGCCFRGEGAVWLRSGPGSRIFEALELAVARDEQRGEGSGERPRCHGTLTVHRLSWGEDTDEDILHLQCLNSGGSQCVEEGREAWKVDWGSMRRGLGVRGWVFATSEGFSEHRSALGFRKLNSDSSIWTFWLGLVWGGSKVESRHPYNFVTLLPWQNNWA